MRKGLQNSGIALGLVALLWGFLLFGPYGALAAEGDLSFLLVPLVAFGAGAVAIVGTLLGRKHSVVGALLLVVAGTAGLVVPAAVIFFSPQFIVAFPASLTAYLAVSWWAGPLVLLGGIIISTERRAAEEASR